MTKWPGESPCRRRYQPLMSKRRQKIHQKMSEIRIAQTVHDHVHRQAKQHDLPERFL